MNPKQKRPIGVTLIAFVFLWIGCLGSLFFPIFGFVGGTHAMWQLGLGSVIHSETWLKVIGYLLDCIWFALYVAYAIIGFGLWKLKNWARMSVLAILIICSALGFVVAFVFVRPILMSISVLGCTLFSCGWIAWYLMRPRVQLAFGAWNRYDSSGACVEPPQLSKRGKLGIGVLCVTSCIVLFAVPLFVAIEKEMRNSDAYKLAIRTAEASPCVLNTLGAPIDAHGIMTGGMEESATEGSAQLSIPLKGPKGKGRLELDAKKLNGSWEIESLILIRGASQSTLVRWNLMALACRTVVLIKRKMHRDRIVGHRLNDRICPKIC